MKEIIYKRYFCAIIPHRLCEINFKRDIMAKKLTTDKSHIERINIALEYIQFHFNETMKAEYLAKLSGYSVFHFHRIFKEITGESVDEYIRNTRLEKAANLLLYNQHQSIEDISYYAGFTTASGFRRAFKKRFDMSPTVWRKNGYEKNPTEIDLKSLEVDESILINPPQIVSNEPIPMLFILTYGYKDDVSAVWRYIYEWCEQKGALANKHRFLGLFHSHPSFGAKNIARYAACVETEEEVYRSGKVGRCTINAGKFAKFSFTCTQKELYSYMHLAYKKWLVNSEYEARNFPAYVEYTNIQALMKNEKFECEFYMPIQLM